LLVCLSAHAQLIDDFESLAAWSAHPSDGVELKIAPDAGAMRFDFDFHQHAGYAIARRAVDLDLPPNFEFTFSMRAEAGVNNLEFKLIDESGENVWWMNRRDFQFPKSWTEIATKKRQIAFAWGPIGGGEPHHIAALEIVVTAGSGGRGHVWIDDLALTALPPPVSGPVTRGTWRAAEGTQTLAIDLGVRREIGGLHIRWNERDFARDFAIELSRDGETFRAVRDIRNNGRIDDFIHLPDEEARVVRLVMRRSSRGAGYAIESLDVEPVDWAPAANDFFAIVAKSARRGAYPRYLIGEQPYWTVIGADGAEAEALVGEDGNVEPFKGGFSIEPFLLVDGSLVTWSDANPQQSLADGDLPIPSVTWNARGVTLTMTAAVSSSSMLMLRYRLRGAHKAKLVLAIRPFQVNPSTQFLNTTGGVSPIRSVKLSGRNVVVDGNRHIHLSTAPSKFITATFDEGDILPHGGYAAAALVFADARDVSVEVPLQKGARRESFAAVARAWREKLDRVEITIPGAPEIANTIRTNLAYMLIHRDGPALEPGSRSYDRAWIRDGSLISAMLLRLGHATEARAFAEWFAKYQFPDGKVPCCVDRRGADPVPENDSHGELIYLVAEIYRITHDSAFVRRLWPHVDAAARYIELLRSQNHGAFEGLVTESISHEGYSAKPMHSYWDDFFALKGLDDAAMLAGVLGLDARRDAIAKNAADFRRDLAASIHRSIDEHHIDYVPGAAELGDFDATATAIAISPLALSSILPQRELQRTFDKYFETIAKPRDDYTPYEMRIIGALIRRGDRTRAMQLVDRFMADRRPAAWNEWAEVVGTDARKPRFIGDMPHAWIASDFMRSIFDAFAFEREDGALIIGSGVPRKWIGNGTLHVGHIAVSGGTIDLRMLGNVVDVTGKTAARRVFVCGQEVAALPARIACAGSD
jgi:hypothetical protein